MPGVQNPHCDAAVASKAATSRARSPASSPSSVVTVRPAIRATGVTHETRGRMQTEVLFLIDRWQKDIDPVVARRRRRVHSTVLAVEEMRRPGLRFKGLQRLFLQGSVPFLLSRPFAWAVRGLRRRVSTPFWMRRGLAA